jgi:hypothetical protein
MKQFRYELPTAIEFESGAIKNLVNHLKQLNGSGFDAFSIGSSNVVFFTELKAVYFQY